MSCTRGLDAADARYQTCSVMRARAALAARTGFADAAVDLNSFVVMFWTEASLAGERDQIYSVLPATAALAARVCFRKSIFAGSLRDEPQLRSGASNDGPCLCFGRRQL